jgi:guanine nucleotide-binding protein G(i) subunit alpha
MYSIVKNLKTYAEKDFIPTADDILRIRTKTVGIVQEKFNSDNLKLLFVDVGGQRKFYFKKR